MGCQTVVGVSHTVLDRASGGGSSIVHFNSESVSEYVRTESRASARIYYV